MNAPLDHDTELIENEMSNLDINNSLFYISKRVKYSLDNSSKTIEPYLSIEKLNIINQTKFKSQDFRTYVKNTIQPMKLRSRYILGLETSTLDWLVEVFSKIAQTKNFFQMFSYVWKLLRKIK